MHIRFLGVHNTELKSARMSSILVDGCIALDAGSLTSSLSLAEQLEIKAVILSHRHYDHIRDVPALAMNLYLNQRSVDIYTTEEVLEIIGTHLLNGVLYPELLHLPPESPTLRFHPVTLFNPEDVSGYQVRLLPMRHSVDTAGIEVVSATGQSLFYTADTGPGLDYCWEQMAPDILIAEVTVPNRYESFAYDSGHLTPALLEVELSYFYQINSYLPPVIAVHMNPSLEAEIAAEVEAVATSLGASITLAREGEEITI